MAAEPTGGVVAPRPSVGRLIVVFGTKGGVGKTVVASNLAVSMAQRLRKPVCLVDLDVMAAADVVKVLNVTAPRSIIDLMPLIKRAASPDQVSLEGIVAPHSSGVHVLTCLSTPNQIGRLDAKALPAVFQILKSRYAYTIVDGGKTFSEHLITAFDASNLILMVASPDVIALYQTKWALGVLESLLFPSSMVKGVLNRAESRGGVGGREVRAAIGCEVIAEIPSDGRIVGTSVNQGVPVVTAFGHTKVAEAFLGLTDMLLTKDSLYVTHQDIPRHRKAETTEGVVASGAVTSWLAHMYGSDEGEGTEEVVDDIVLLKRRIHEQLVEELDLKKMDLASMARGSHMSELRKRTERVIANLLAKEMGGLVSSHEVRTRLVKELTDEALGLGPLEDLLADPGITDILVNNKDQIYIERKGKLELSSKKFISNDQVRAVIERIVAPLGRRVDESTPMVDARLPDGSRVNAIIPPLSTKGPVLSIRKFARVRYSAEDLVKFNSLSPAMVQFIRACVLSRKNMLISGGTGSGKTTFLNIVSAFIPDNERIVTIEDAAELKLAQMHWVGLESRPPSVEGKGQISIRDLFRNALRMRPDRIVIGECRGGETLDMLQAMNTGHDGSITTIHANSTRDVIGRMDSMVLMSNIDLPIRAIREMVASAIDVIIHTARLSDGTRKVMAITELVELVNGTEVVFRDLFKFHQSGVASDGTVLGEFLPTGQMPTFFSELKVKGYGLDESIFLVNAKPATEPRNGSETTIPAAAARPRSTPDVLSEQE